MKKSRLPAQFLVAMIKFTCFHLFLVILTLGVSMAGNSYSQEALARSVTFRTEGQDLKTVLSLIEKRSKVKFSYDLAVMPTQKINFRAEAEPLSSVLEKLLKPLRLMYTVSGKYIIISREIAGSEIVPQDLLLSTESLVPVKEVRGKVTDEQGEPLPGVSILVKGTQQGLITDAEGRYSIDAPNENSVLVFSFVGFVTQEVVVGTRNSIDVSLQVDEKGLEEVVVVGYGTQKKVNLTGAVSTITSKDLSVVPSANVATLMYGNLPGLTTLQRNGRPGQDDVSLSIRGFSNALIVVDGVVGRSFTRLDPSEIESITILKDAASTAVYGVSGGNGVILVTTKRGESGKPVFSYNANYGVQHLTKYPKYVNSAEYATLKNEAAINAGGAPVYTREEIEKYRLGTDPNYPNFDYFDYMIRDYPPQFQQDISVRGGSKNIRYFFLLGQIKQETMWKGADEYYKKYNFRSSVDADINDDLTISVDVSGRLMDRSQMTQQDVTMGSWFQYQWPILKPRNPDGTITTANYGLTAYLDRDLTGYWDTNEQVYETSLTANYKVPFVKGLSVNLRGTYDMYFNQGKTWSKQFWTYHWDEATQTSTRATPRDANNLSQSAGRSIAARIFTSLNYQRSFAAKHNVNALLLHEVFEDRASSLSASRVGYQVPIDQLFAGPDLGKNNGGSASDAGRESYVGRVNYDYAGKYLFEYSFRYDGSAKFPPATRWGYFSGVSAGWRISEEEFFKNSLSTISNLKIRGSWGELGSDRTGNFQFLAGYSYPSGSYIFGGNNPTRGMNDTGIPNPNITWETSQIFNLGLEVALWDRLLEIEGDVFYRKREGILAKRLGQLPLTFGGVLPDENLNADNTRGFEIVLRHNKAIRKDFRYSIWTNASFTRSRYTHLEQRNFVSQYDNWRNNYEGRWMNLRFGYKAIGQFQSVEEIYSSPIQDGRGNSTLRPGDIKYDDYNKDGVINDNDTQIIGRGDTPEISYGLGANVSWKRFSMSMNWAGAANYEFLKASFTVSPFWEDQTAYALFMDRWHREDPWDPDSKWIPGKYPSTINRGSPNNNISSSFWLTSANYLRLKSLNIGYDVNVSFLEKLKVQSLTVYLSGQNLLTFSKLGPFDPENNNGRNNYYPQQKTYNVGLNLKF